LAHEQTHLSNNTIDSIRHREVGRAKNLSAPPHIMTESTVLPRKFTQAFTVLHTSFFHAYGTFSTLELHK